MKTRMNAKVVWIILCCATARGAANESISPSDWAIPPRYEGQIISKRVRFFPEKILALTFDDGPSKEVTPRVLDILAAYDAHATFFVRGDEAKLHPDLLRRIVAEGNVIGNHSFSHPKQESPAQAVAEIQKTNIILRQTIGRAPTLFRPPYGLVHSNLTKAAIHDGFTVVTWTISSADSRPIGPDVIANNVIHTPNPGDIVIMHDSDVHAATADALPLILKQLGDQGYKFVTIPELLRAWDKYLQE